MKEEALMPGSLRLCELTMLDRRHQESQEWSETKETTWRTRTRRRRRDVEAAEEVEMIGRKR